MQNTYQSVLKAGLCEYEFLSGSQALVRRPPKTGALVRFWAHGWR
jgi:hypothetical protein